MINPYPSALEVKEALEYFKNWDWRRNYLDDSGGEVYLPILIQASKGYVEEVCVDKNGKKMEIEN